MARFARAVAVAAASILLLAGCTAPAADETPSPTAAPAAQTVEDSFTPVLAQTLAVPRGLPTSDGRVHVAYELLLSNVTTQTATVEQIDVVDESGDSVATLDGDEVTGWMHVSGTTAPGRVIGPGQNALVWLDVVVDSMDALPSRLTHDITFAFEPGAPPVISNRMTERVAETEVDRSAPIVIGPPLRGPGWLNGNSCCAVTPHRGAVNAINGSFHAPERYAIDYVQLDADGSFVTGPIDELESYPYFGADIVAVGDGPIVSMRFDLPEQTPGANPTGLTLDEYGGNHVVQDLGDGVYAFYAHLQPDNPAGVEVGQVLKKGDVLGLLGNTGNTDSPHLHFHLMDSPSPLGSNGIPFVYDTYELEGTISAAELDEKIAAGGPFAIDAAGAGSQTDLYPIWLTVTGYPEG
ncbi:M23 family metallopeptidase [Microbacterium sp.]|uniref:M23 family metallopeptidase n=1 Tax=Microbacterium sp. TaxID=51671 RepID=UPI003F6E936A